MTSDKQSVRKRVLFLTYHLPMGQEPGAFRPWMEARLLRDAGCDVTVVTSGVQYMTGADIRSGPGWCSEETVDNIRILRTWAPTDHRRSLIRRTLNYLSYTLLAGVAALTRAGRADAVLAGTDPIFVMPMVFLISRIKRAALILDERDLFPETAIASGVISPGAITWLLSRLQMFFRRSASKILAATPGIERTLIEYGIPRSKVELLYNADAYFDDDIDLSSPPSKEIEQLTGDRFVVGYAGGLGRVNDVGTLVRSASYLRDLTDLVVVIVGNGEMKEAYKDYCRDQGLRNVHMLDARPRREARALIRKFSVGVQPLPPHDHFSHTLTSKTFDYHAAACPMIFCGKGDTVELLRQSGGGLVVEPGQPEALAACIRELYCDDEMRLTMAHNARSWYESNVTLSVGIETFRRLVS